MKRKKDEGRRILRTLTHTYLAILCGIYLLYPGSGGYQTITAQKWNVYLLITGIYIGSAFLLRVELAVVGTEAIPPPKKAWQSLDLTQKLVLAYLLVTALSTALSDDLHTALWGGARHEGLIAIALYCLSFLLVSTYGEPKRWMLWLASAAISVNCVLCLIQFARYNPLGLYPDGMNYYDANIRYAGEYLGTIGNVDILSAVLSLAIPAFWMAFLRMKGGKHRFFLLPPMILCLVVLLKAFVAGGILGTAGAIVLSVPVLPASKDARKKALIAVICLFVAAATAVYFLGRYMGGFLYEASELMHGRWDDSFGSGRLYIWRNVIQLVPEHPLLGGGPDTLGLRTTAAFERYDESLGILIHSAIDTAHNEYLNILVNQGAVALALYLLMLGVSTFRWVRDAGKSITVAVCGCAVLGYCIHALFGISSPISAPYLWIALALMNSCSRSCCII